MPIPEGYVAERRTPVFTQDTMPAALLQGHETTRGAWATINVLEGRLRYLVDEPPFESILEPGRPGVIEPGNQHRVEPLGPVRFYLEFHYAPGRHPRSDL